MAARSFAITVQNWLGGGPWHRTNSGLAHGAWSNGESAFPPEQVPPVFLTPEGDAQPGIVFWESESDGFATGTEGFADYHNDKWGDMHVWWDNPYVGGNSFGVDHANNSFRAEWGDTSGNDANVVITLRRV